MSATSAGKIAGLNAARLGQTQRAVANGARATVRKRRRNNRQPARLMIDTSPSMENESQDVQRSTLNTLASFIPSEALAFYLAGIPLLNALTPANDDTKRAAAISLFAIALAGNVALLLLAQVRQVRSPSKDNGVGAGVRLQVSQFLLALVVTGGAFFLYALTQQNGFLQPSGSWSAFFLLIGVFVLGGLVRLFGLGPLEPHAEATSTK